MTHTVPASKSNQTKGVFDMKAKQILKSLKSMGLNVYYNASSASIEIEVDETKEFFKIIGERFVTIEPRRKHRKQSR